jgi:hypothetical protein
LDIETNLSLLKVGKVLEVEINVQGARHFVRAQIKIDVWKPLASFVSMSRVGQSEVYQIRFEQIMRFCGACSMIRQSLLECGIGEYEEDT